MKIRNERNPSIEVLRVLLMFGICLCHSVGAGGYMCVPLRNVCMMCTVGFIFITGWFGVRFTLARILKLLGVAVFALGVVVAEDILWNGSMTVSPLVRMRQWWFLNSYVMLLALSPILNTIVSCVISADGKIRRDALLSVLIGCVAIYGLAWPMHCHWMPRIRFFLTLGCPCQFGTICVIYLLARVIRLTGIFERMNNLYAGTGVLVSVALAMCSYKFSYYNSPIAFLFSASLFYFLQRVQVRNGCLVKMILWMAPSMFFVYLYHSHFDPGFQMIKSFESVLVKGGWAVPFVWLLTAAVIFAIGVGLDALRRMLVDCVFRCCRKE